MVSGLVTTPAALLFTFAGHSSLTKTNRCTFYGVSIRRGQTLTRPGFFKRLAAAPRASICAPLIWPLKPTL